MTAAEFLNHADEAEIARVLKEYGEEPRARAVARAIVAARPLTRTAELAAVVRKALGYRQGQKSDPATRTFQAIRIHLNAELDELEQGLARRRARRCARRPAGGGHLPQPRGPHRQALPPHPQRGDARRIAPSPDGRAPDPPRRSSRSPSRSPLPSASWPETRARARRGCVPQSAPMRPRGTRRRQHERARISDRCSGREPSPARRSASIWFRCGVASERAALEDVETEIVLAQRDIRLLQTEIGTRGRLAQLERWNVKVHPPVRAERRPVRRRRLPAGDAGQARAASRRSKRRSCWLRRRSSRRRSKSPRLTGDAVEPAASRSSRPVSEMIHVASYTVPERPEATAPARQPAPKPISADARRAARSRLRRSPSKPRRPTRSRPCLRPSPRPKAARPRRPPRGNSQAPTLKDSAADSMNAPTPALVARPERLRLVGQRRQILAVMHQRLMFGMLVYAGIIAIIALRLIYLAAFGDHAGRKVGLIDLTPERGDIVDRDGQALARTIDAWTIGLQPTKIIGNKLDLAQQACRADAGEGRGNLSRDAAVGPQLLLSAPPRAARPGRRRSTRLASRGWRCEREPDRLYPQTSLAAHVIGYTDIDGKGNAGHRARVRRAAARSRAARRADRACRSPARSSRRWSMSCGDAMNHFSAIGAAGHRHGHP